MNQFATEPTGNGGKRPGAGRPRKAQGAPLTPTQTDNERYARARAEHEEIKLQQRALALQVEQGKLISRAAVEAASATVLAYLAQGLRALPDNLERQFNLAPDVVEAIERAIDAQLDSLADGLELLHEPRSPG